MAHTGAARAGVENLTKTLAVEWSEYNIRINCVAPGTIESSGLKTYPKPVQDMFEEAREAVPLKRFGTVEDVANTVCFWRVHWRVISQGFVCMWMEHSI